MYRMWIKASPSSSGSAMSFPVGRLADADEMADESVAGGGGMTGVARAVLKTDEAMDNTAEEQRSPVLCTH